MAFAIGNKGSDDNDGRPASNLAEEIEQAKKPDPKRSLSMLINNSKKMASFKQSMSGLSASLKQNVQ